MTINDCCSPCGSTPPPVNIPGVGGQDAFSYTTAVVTVPAAGSPQILVPVYSVAPFLVGETVGVFALNPITETGPKATFAVNQVGPGLQIGLVALGLNSDSSPGTLLAAGSLVSPVGVPGKNAFSTTTGSVLINGGGPFTISIDSTDWMSVNQTVFISNGTFYGTFNITSLTGTSITAFFLFAPGDSIPTFTLASGSLVTPSRPLQTGLAASGNNSDITSLSALNVPLSVGQGGTGVITLAAIRAALQILSGTAVLVAGSVTVSTQNITGASVIIAELNTPGGSRNSFAGYKITSVTPGTPGSFVITAITDTGATINTCADTVSYMIIQ